MHKNYVLVYEWHKDDGWYGANFRAILSLQDKVGFPTLGALNQHRTLFKNHVNKRFKLEAKNKDMKTGLREDFKSFIYCGSGPSLSYKHFDVNLEDIK